MRDRRPDAPLTPTQQRVTRLLAEGMTNAEIGEALGIATRTVAVHVSDALLRTGAKNRTHLAVLYVLDRL